MENYTKKEIDMLDNARYYNSTGDYHRTDGPAVEHMNGGKSWYLNGKRHRFIGPAVIYPTGGKEWWVNGKRHRLNGPAIIHHDGTKHWYVNNGWSMKRRHNRLVLFFTLEPRRIDLNPMEND